MSTAKVAVNNAFVMSCTIEQLVALAVYAGMSPKQIAKAKDPAKLRAIVGTKLANNPATRDLLAAGTLEVELPVSEPTPEPEPAKAASGATSRKSVKSAKDWLRELLSQPGASYTLAELVALTGKSEVNIRTMLSDLRSSRYAGKGGVFNTKSTRVNGKTYYSAA